jgi:hypothetical protein
MYVDDANAYEYYSIIREWEWHEERAWRESGSRVSNHDVLIRNGRSALPRVPSLLRQSHSVLCASANLFQISNCGTEEEKVRAY